MPFASPKILAFVLLSVGFVHMLPAQSSNWPQPRADDRLTAIQPVPGALKDAPQVIAQIDLARQPPMATSIAGADGKTIRAAIIGGELRCYSAQGQPLWASHPPGINFTSIVTSGDLDGGGHGEILLKAGRPAEPYGAVVIVSTDDGRVLWRYDVQPMSYYWDMQVFDKQIFVIMHGYPPDARNGYCVMFAASGAGGDHGWQQKWRYDFPEYTCFPNVQEVDFDGDGRKELAIVSHSRMWVLDERDGAVKQFLKWDVSPANVRSYGLNQYVDLNRDGKPDFLCLGRFSKHYEVLLNDGGQLKEAWHYGWPESVMTGKVALAWPLPAYGDVDGDGRKEVVVSVFNGDGDQAWTIRVHDAITGALKFKQTGMIAARLVDVGGKLMILADRSDSGADADADGGYTIRHVKAAALLQASDGALRTVWERDGARAIREETGPPRVQLAGQTLALDAEKGEFTLIPPKPAPPVPTTALATLPSDAPKGPTPDILAADILGDGSNQLLLYTQNKAVVWKFAHGQFTPVAQYESSCLPILADLDGDGKLEIVTMHADPGTFPRFKAVTPALHDRVLWDITLAPPNRAGLPQPRIAYMRPGHFTGRKQPDIYAWVGTPIVRSFVLRGDSGAVVWEKGQIGDTERYWGPTHNLTSAFDANGDGNDDLVFTDPDDYCVASGPTGEFLAGPLPQSKIFDQPSQGLYTMPVILKTDKSAATANVCLVGGHYYRAMISLDAKPKWYALPTPGEARCANEGFLHLNDGTWLIGFGRQDGKFACLNASDGSPRWQLDLAASCSDVAACDIDGDGSPEFIFGTSHGTLYAVADRDGKPRVLWKVNTGVALGSPTLADIDDDGKTDIIVPATDGRVRVYGVNR